MLTIDAPPGSTWARAELHEQVIRQWVPGRPSPSSYCSEEEPRAQLVLRAADGSARESPWVRTARGPVEVHGGGELVTVGAERGQYVVFRVGEAGVTVCDEHWRAEPGPTGQLAQGALDGLRCGDSR